MKVSTEKVGESQIALTIELDPERVQRSVNSAYQRLSQRTQVPGFRKGKAPRAILERYVGGPAVVLEDALDRLVPDVYNEAIDQESIYPVAQPHIELVQTDPVVIKATVDVRPEVALGDYQAVRVEPEAVDFDESKVDENLQRLREQMAPFEPVERPIEWGDRVTLQMKSWRDDEEFLDRDDYEIDVDKDWRFPVPGFVDQLIGLAAGETKEFPLAFAADHEDQRLQGQNYRFQVTVSEVKARKLPELNDEFAQSLEAGFEDFAALRQRIHDNLKAEAERAARQRLEDKVVEAVVDQAEAELPPSLVEREIDRLIEDRMDRLRQLGLGLSWSQFLRQTGKDEAEARAELAEEARKRVKRRWVLAKIADAEDIKVEDAEIAARIDRMTNSEGHEGHDHAAEDERLRQLLTSEEGRESLENVLLAEKIIERLVQIATGGESAITSSAEPADEDEFREV